MRKSILVIWLVALMLILILESRANPLPVGPAAAGPVYGDVNQDGLVNIFDLLAILRQISGKEPANEYSDLDGNGKTDVFDLLEWLGIYRYMKTPPEIAASINEDPLDEPVVHSFTWLELNGEARDYYTIYSNKEIARAELILNGDTAYGISGKTPVILAADPDSVKFVDHHIFTEPVPWKINVWDMYGNLSSDSGASKFIIAERGLMVDKSIIHVGDEIVFPLILNGPTQRFRVEINRWLGGYQYAVDLNPSGNETVIYENMEQLAEQIIAQVTLSDVYAVRPIYAGAAFSRDTGLMVNRLCIFCDGCGDGTMIEALDGNEKLIEQIGFPTWKQQHYSLTNNWNYVYNEEVYQSMRERYSNQ